MGIKERREREKERRRQQIIVAARRVFSDKGYTRATMEDIASEAELSPGTLYLYFKSKDELYASLCLRVLQFMHIKLDQVRSQQTDHYHERQANLIAAMHEIYSFDPFILNNLFHLQSSETLLNLSADLISQITHLSQLALDDMVSVFKHGIDQKEIIQHHPNAVTDVFWALFSGVVLWEETKRITNSETITLADHLETAFAIFCRGIRYRATNHSA